MDKRLALPLTLGLAHGAADGTAGLLLGGLAPRVPLTQVAMLVLLYNVLAFGAQPLAGLLTDQVRKPRAAALAGLALLAGALVAGGAWPQLAIVLAGLGSAAFHVGGGALALCATQGRASGPGLFAAPGVVGLAAGGALAAAGYRAAWLFLALLIILAGIIAWQLLPQLPYPAAAAHAPAATTPAAFEPHDIVMLVLLAAIALRSAVWSSLQFVSAGRYDLLLALALAAALGKILGGVLADWVGWRRWAVGALLAATTLLAFGNQNLVALLTGVALLQAATPVGLALAARLAPERPATAAGLTLGLAVAIGGLPQLGGFGAALSSPIGIAGTLLAAALAIWWAFSTYTRAPVLTNAHYPSARQL